MKTEKQCGSILTIPIHRQKLFMPGADGEYLMKENQTFPGVDVAAGEKLALGSWDVQIIREK